MTRLLTSQDFIKHELVEKEKLGRDEWWSQGGISNSPRMLLRPAAPSSGDEGYFNA